MASGKKRRFMILSGVFVVLLAGVGGYAYSKAQHQVVVTNGPIHRGLNMGMAAMKPYTLQLTLPPNNVHPGDHVLAEVTIHANRDVSFDQPLVMLVKRPDELSIDPTFEPATKEEPIADLPTQLKRGETFHKSIPFTAPAQPGYYQFNVDGQHRAHGQFPSGTPPMTLYVAYDSSSLRLGTLQINKSTMVNKHTFVVKQITMGTENTKIAVNISNPTYNQGLYFKLLDQDGKQIQTLKPVSNLGGNGNDTLTFAPIPQTVKRLKFVVTKFENATKPNVFATEPGGPWSVEFPLDQS